MKTYKNQDIFLFSLISFTAVSLLGTLLHFVYDIFGGRLSALFSGVNESTWEHMKLLFFPMLLSALIGRALIGGEYKNYWLISLSSILLGLLLIPVLYYTLMGIFGKTPGFVNIGIFFVSAGAAYLYEYRTFKKNALPEKYEGLSAAVLALLAALFFLFTFLPPEIPLFEDPTNGRFGI